MKDETRKDVPAAEPEQETKRIPQPEETQYDLEEILEEALEEQYTPPTQENGETPEPEADQAAGQGEDAPEPEETAEGEPEAISVPEADAEGEQEETERFIQEQVTSALGDTYSEETLRKQEERAAQMRKVRAHQEAQQEKARRKVRRKKAVEATVRNWKRTLIPKSQEPSEEGEQDNVIQMPVSKLKPFRDVMGRVTEKALHYADEMYEQSEPLDPEEELQEKYIPATDEEQPVRRKKWRKERKPRRLIKPEEDIPPSELAKRYSKGLSKMKFRIRTLLILCVVLLYLTIAADGTLPLPQFFQVETKVTAGILLWGMGVACLLGLDVLWLGITAPKRGRIGAHTLMVCGVAATLLDNISYCLLGRE